LRYNETYLGFLKADILLADGVWRAETHHHAKFHQNQSTHCGYIAISQDGGCPPSWICFKLILTTYKEYLVVSIIVQNLVTISAVILII